MALQVNNISDLWNNSMHCYFKIISAFNNTCIEESEEFDNKLVSQKSQTIADFNAGHPPSQEDLLVFAIP